MQCVLQQCGCTVMPKKLNDVSLQMWMNVPVTMVAALRSVTTPLAPTIAPVSMGSPCRLTGTRVKVGIDKQHKCSGLMNATTPLFLGHCRHQASVLQKRPVNCTLHGAVMTHTEPDDSL